MHVVVTGASSGIGAALARAFAARGASLTLVARRVNRLAELAATFARPSHVVEADLGDHDQATGWLAGAETALGPIDVLINNAGMQIVDPFEATHDHANNQVITVNLMTPLALCRAVLPGMLARGAGSMVNIASLAALAPTPYMASYNASKAGLAAASEALRHELRGTGVRVVTVYPGPVHTDMADAAYARYAAKDAKVGQLPTGRPEVLAGRVVRAVERSRARVVYPSIYRAAAWFPGTARWFTGRLAPRLRG